MKKALIFAIAAAGCGPETQSVRLSPTVLDPTPAASPIHLFSATLPRCAFQDIGLITSKRSGDLTSSAAVLDGLRDQARRLGGDAVVNVRFVDEGVLGGTVIRFASPDCKD